jgi:hypothetical protein
MFRSQYIGVDDKRVVYSSVPAPIGSLRTAVNKKLDMAITSSFRTAHFQRRIKSISALFFFYLGVQGQVEAGVGTLVVRNGRRA